MQTSFSKAKKHWILRSVKPSKQHAYRDNLINKIIERRTDTAIRMDDHCSRLAFPHLKANIATTDKPPLAQAIKNRYSRLHTES